MGRERERERESVERERERTEERIERERTEEREIGRGRVFITCFLVFVLC